MLWTQITFQVASAQALKLSDSLTDAGCLAVTFLDAIADGVEEPLYEPPPGETPLWQATQVVGLFETGTDTEEIVTRLRMELGLGVIAAVHVETVPDQDWQRLSLDSFHPLQFGVRLWVCPSWLTPPDPAAVNLLLDPGLAFGTGTHATTALCLDWLAEAELAGLNVIDYGCGSGILAVAAARLGAAAVWALDNDPQAVLATCDNALKNRVEKQITVTLTDVSVPLVADVLLANILAAPLIGFAQLFADLTRDGGHIVLSGILQAQGAAVSLAYQKEFIMAAPVERDGWVRLEGRRKSDKV